MIAFNIQAEYVKTLTEKTNVLNFAVMLQASFTIAVYTTVSTTIYKNKRFNIYWNKTKDNSVAVITNVLGL